MRRISPQAVYGLLPVSLQNVACSLKGRHLLKTRFAPEFHDLLDMLKETQWWEAERFQKQQDQDVANLIRHAYEAVPYYQRVMKQRGLTPKDFNSAADLTKLPILTKEIVQQEGDNMVSRGFDLKHNALHCHTSGTTGAGLQFWVSNRAVRYQWAVWWRHRSRFGIELGQLHADFSGQMVVPYHVQRPPFWRENRPLRQTYLSLYHLKEENLPAYVEMLESRDFKYYTGYPSGMFLVADYLRSINHKLSRPPQIVIGGAESLLPFQRKAFQEWLGAPSTDQYGQAEGVANLSRCEDDRYHVDMEFCATEFQKVADSPDGSICKILGTGLHNYAQPFIRYDTGDLATTSPEACPCGRHAPVITYIDGRIESYVLTPDGRKIGRMDHCFKDITTIREAQIIQHAVDELEVKVVPTDAFDTSEEKRLSDEIVSRVGKDMKVAICRVNAIERGKSGKFRAVISEIDNHMDEYIQ